MIGQNQGKNLENELIHLINNKSYLQIQNNVKTLLNKLGFRLFSEDIFYALKPKSANRKTDIIISNSNNQSVNISVKSGRGNSVHQEKINDFCDLLIELGFEEEEIDNVLFFHWCDYTLNNSGFDRKKSKEFKNIHKDRYIKLIDSYSRIKNILIPRLLIGNDLNYIPDYLVYIDSQFNFYPWEMDFVINFHVNKNDSKKTIGNLSSQTWNLCVNRNPMTEKRRYSIQWKWGNILKDMESFLETNSRNI